MHDPLKNRIPVQRLLAALAVLLLLSASLIHFLRLNLWDYDFWFHISSGRHILSELHLPEKDAFSYPLQLAENKNEFPEFERFILRQYWLAQIIFYEIFALSGPAGIIILRSVLLVLVLVVALVHFQRHKVSPSVAVPFLYLLYLISQRSAGERPVLFSFLFAGIVFSVLDRQREGRTRSLFLLPPLMMLWSNMHGGFIVGDVIILAFLGGAMFERFFVKHAFSPKDLDVFAGICALSLLCSLCNPNGWNSFLIAFSPKYQIFFKGIQEWESPFMFYFNKIRPMDYPYLVLLVLTVLIALLRNRKLSIVHILLLAGFLFMSVKSARFVFFFAIIAVMIIGPEYDRLLKTIFARILPEPVLRKLGAALLLLVLCGASVFFWREATVGKIPFGIARNHSVPERAVDFIEKNDVQGNIFNEYGYGGYLTWRLYPKRMNFIDTRSLNLPVMIEYGWIQNATENDPSVAPSRSHTPLWKRLLKHYQVNYILVAPTDMYAIISPLVLALLDGEEWIPVHLDRISIIFVKNTEPNRRLIEQFRVPALDVYNMIISQSAEKALSDRVNPRHLATLGEVFYRMGRIDDAVKAYQHALQRFPENAMMKRRLAQLEEESRTKKQGNGKTLAQ
ncbi:MAG: hypothetical protein OHK006_12330 [Thermodesulfovibrionales bacterium]